MKVRGSLQPAMKGVDVYRTYPVPQKAFTKFILLGSMNRRQALCGMTIGSVGLLSGCLGQALPTSESGGLTIEYHGDSEPNKRRDVLVTMTRPSTGSLFNATTENTIKLTDETAVFYVKYELKPDETVRPHIFVGEPDQYRLEIWIEARGTIGTDVKIGEDGTLTDSHSIIIREGAIEHR